MANKNIRSLAARKGIDKNLFEEIAINANSENAIENLKKVATVFQVDNSLVAGTASFYDFTKAENSKHKIFVCNGTACMCANTQDKLISQLKSNFKEEEIGYASCIGHCHTNAAFMYKDQTYSATSKKEIDAILKNNPSSNNAYKVDCNTIPILTKNSNHSISSFFAFAETLKDKPETVILELKTANLRGRGGAGFPFWFKLDAVIKEKNKQKYIVCNADEGDPGAFSDMYLLEEQPYKVLFGMYISGLTVGANTAVLYIRGEYPNAIRTINESIAFLNKNNLTPNFKWKTIKGQGSYVCGEETALLSSIEGLRPEVRVRPPYPAQYGLYGKPTVLSNVETFANLYYILKNGGNTYANLGNKQSTGTKLISLDSFFNQPGIYEIEMGTPLLEIIEKYGKGFKSEIKAIQIGGPLGGIIPVHKLQELTLDFESLNTNGFLLGHASFVCIPKDFPILKYIEHLLKFTADESCGKCYPCRIGSFRGFEMVQKAGNSTYKIDRQLFNDLLETLEIGSLCALGGGVPLPIKNALEHFNQELEMYFS
ncbi:MAG: NAD(P)H-dependent oxidoreductase subunit E [Flavobacteriaceae bacterium]|nr:NAD(P)H-dependent oxidoreductase subunit E [Flavobacteriaceae bacterium]